MTTGQPGTFESARPVPTGIAAMTNASSSKRFTSPCIGRHEARTCPALCAVAALVLLARPAPARIVAPELLVLGRDPLAWLGNCGRDRLSPARRGDRPRPGQRLVLVGEAAVR